NMNLTKRDRLRLYIHLVGVKPPLLFIKMVEEMRTKSSKNEFAEVISLDVKRSLGKTPHLQPVVEKVLLMFSFYHFDVGYVQGMNYLGENIMKLTQGNQEQLYTLFEFVLLTYYSDIFGAKFDGLKLRIYQFSRLLERY